MNRLIADENGRIARLAQSQRQTGDIIDELYWSALSRPPSAEELQTAVALVDGAANRHSALEDILWALVTSSVFLLRR